MQDFFYRIGYSIMLALPVILALFCIMKIRKNRREIKKLEDEERNSSRSKGNPS